MGGVYHRYLYIKNSIMVTVKMKKIATMLLLGIILIFTIAFIIGYYPKAEYRWSGVEGITFNDRNDYDVGLTIYDDKLYAVWTEANISVYNIVAKCYDGEWSNVIGVTGNSTGFNGFPQLAVYNNNLYVVWVSGDPSITGSNNWDVVVKDYGKENITPLDFPTTLGFPYRVAELCPSLTVYNNSLYAVWSVTGPMGGGKASNIVVQDFNCSEWGNIHELIPMPVAYAGFPCLTVYENNLYIFYSFSYEGKEADIRMSIYDGEWREENKMLLVNYESDSGFDMFPRATVYHNKLYVAWMTNDTGISNGDDYDIVIRCFDGKNWGDITEVTYKSDEGYDGFPCLTVFDNKLFVAWTTNDTGISHGNDFDVVLRYYDGSKWSSIQEITFSDDIGDDRCPQMIVYKNKLHVFWESNSSTIDGDDYDIVYRILSKIIVPSFSFFKTPLFLVKTSLFLANTVSLKIFETPQQPFWRDITSLKGVRCFCLHRIPPFHHHI